MASDEKPIIFDEDNPEWTEEDFARALPASELPAHFLAAFPKTKVRGRPVGSTTSEKQLISLRLDKDVIAKFRAGGPGWQSRINETLRLAKV